MKTLKNQTLSASCSCNDYDIPPVAKHTIPGGDLPGEGYSKKYTLYGLTYRFHRPVPRHPPRMSLSSVQLAALPRAALALIYFGAGLNFSHGALYHFRGARLFLHGACSPTGINYAVGLLCNYVLYLNLTKILLTLNESFVVK